MKNQAYLTAIVVTTAFVTGCKPVKVLDIKEVKPNETAWAIPLDGSAQDGQVKFNSVGFLDQKKVAMKRIMIDKVERSVGRFWFDIEWIPAVRVITVDRSLVTREWTDNDKTGSSAKRDGIPVNTRDNIALTIGLTVTASIEEDEASTYLYYHGEKPLSEVTDVNIRSFAVAELNRQVSAMTLTEFQQRQTEIYTKLFADTASYYKTKGVTIQYLGNAEGWHFAHKEIQDSINRSFTAQQDNRTAEMEQQAQKTRNQTMVLNQETANQVKILAAQAEADSARKLMEVKEAAEFQNRLQVALLAAQAQMKMATTWDGKMPSNILPSNSPLLLQLGR